MKSSVVVDGVDVYTEKVGEDIFRRVQDLPKKKANLDVMLGRAWLGSVLRPR